jgi:Limiting CO2-inducible proteins B/C beta carbonyic anhydrases
MSDGTLGRVAREGRAGESTACGALCALQKAIQSGHLDTEFHMDDIEMSIMKQIIARNLEWGEQPDIIRLTHISSKCIAEQLEDMITKMVNTDKADYAVISGVQIHGPGLCQNYFMPTLDSCYAVVKGQKIQLDVGDAGISASTK